MKSVLNTSAGNKAQGRRKLGSLSLQVVYLGCGCYSNHGSFSEGLSILGEVLL